MEPNKPTPNMRMVLRLTPNGWEQINLNPGNEDAQPEDWLDESQLMKLLGMVIEDINDRLEQMDVEEKLSQQEEYPEALEMIMGAYHKHGGKGRP